MAWKVMLAIPSETPAQERMRTVVLRSVAMIAGGFTEWNIRGVWRASDGEIFNERGVMVLVTGLTNRDALSCIEALRGQARVAGEKAIWYDLEYDTACVEVLTEAKGNDAA